MSSSTVPHHDENSLTPKRVPSLVGLNMSSTPKRRKLKDTPLPNVRDGPLQAPVDLALAYDEAERKKRLCMHCGNVLDSALIPPPCGHGQIHPYCAFSWADSEMLVLHHATQKLCKEPGCGSDITEFVDVARALHEERMFTLQKPHYPDGQGLSPHSPNSPLGSPRVAGNRTTGMGDPDKLRSLTAGSQLFTSENRLWNEESQTWTIIRTGGYSSWEIEKHRQLDIEVGEEWMNSDDDVPVDDEWLNRQNPAPTRASQPVPNQPNDNGVSGKPTQGISNAGAGGTKTTTDNQDSASDSDDTVPQRKPRKKNRKGNASGKKGRKRKEPASAPSPPSPAHSDELAPEKAAAIKVESQGGGSLEPKDVEYDSDVFEVDPRTPECAACPDHHPSEEIHAASCGHTFHTHCLSTRLAQYFQLPIPESSTCNGPANDGSMDICKAQLMDLFRQVAPHNAINKLKNPIAKDTGLFSLKCMECNKDRPTVESNSHWYYYG
jgi:hypothetical protein